MSLAFDRTVDMAAAHGRDVLERALSRGGRTADLFAEESLARSLSHRVRRGRSAVFEDRAGRIAGAGIHVFDAHASAYSSTEDVSVAGLNAAADQVASSFAAEANAAAPAGSLSDSEAKTAAVQLGTLQSHGRLPPDSLEEATETEARELLHRASDAARSLVPDVQEVEVTLQGRSRRIAVASSDGRFASSVESRVNLRVRLYGRDGLHVHAVGGGAGGLALFTERRPEDVAREAAERLTTLTAARAKAHTLGEMPVVIAGGWGGVWLHEVLGHALEADVCSFASERQGEQIAADHVTVVDHSTANGVDDEGTPLGRTVLVRRGVLSALLTDRASALRRGLAETGNGRRQDYRYPPLVRMTNLMLESGRATPEDLVRAADGGLFVRMIGGGRVVPAEDRFSFDVLEGYLVESGQIGTPVRGLRIQGRPSEMLRGIVGIGNDFSVDSGRGICEKKGQVVPVSVGMPTILVNRMSISPLK